MDDFDELDRALFALPLELPPAGLRASILSATIYRSAPVQAAFNAWETGAIGVALAVAAWLVILSFADRAFATTLTLDVRLLLGELGDPSTLAWLGTGVSLAILVLCTNFNVLRNGRS